MAKIRNISEIHPTLGFTEFDILEKYRKSFNESELGRLHSVFPFESMAKAAGLSQCHLGRRNCFSPSAKIALMVLKAYTGFSVILLLLLILYIFFQSLHEGFRCFELLCVKQL